MKNTNGNPKKIARNIAIAHEHVAGSTTREIAKRHNLTSTHISAILSDKEIQQIIQTERERMIKLVPTAVDNFKAILSNTKHGDNYKASKDILQANGFLSTHAPAPQYNTFIFQDNRKLLSPNMQEILQKQQADNDSSMEAEYEVLETDNGET